MVQSRSGAIAISHLVSNLLKHSRMCGSQPSLPGAALDGSVQFGFVSFLIIMHLSRVSRHGPRDGFMQRSACSAHARG